MVQRGGAVVDGVYGIACPLQTAAQEVGNSLLVLHHQDSHLYSAYPNRQAAKNPSTDVRNLILRGPLPI